MKQGRPPPVARRVLAALTPEDDRPFVLGDLTERFAEITHLRGGSAARRWYRKQAVKALGIRARSVALPIISRGHRDRGGPLRANGLRQTVRSLARRPLYLTGVSGTLALGLASAAVVFVVAWRVWLAPLPFPDPDRVVRLIEVEADGDRWRFSPPLLEDFRAHEWQTLTAVSAVSRNNFDWETGSETRRLSALTTSPEFFQVLGMAPEVGRFFSEDERAPEVILNESFWRREFGGDREVVGATRMTLNGETHQVVGVVSLPSGYPPSSEILTRRAVDEASHDEGMRGARYLDVVARVAPGWTAAEAGAEVDAFISTLGDAHPQHRGWGGGAIVLGDDLIRPYRGILGLLLAAGLTFLVLAVVNVSGLVVARRTDDRNEQAVRIALGASRGHLLAGSLQESIAIGTLGSLAGLVGTYALLGPVGALIPPDIPRAGEVALDPWLAGTILATGLILSVIIGTTGHALGPRSGAPTPQRGNSPSGTGARQFMVVGQVALTTLLVFGGAILLRGALTLRAVDVGFEAQGVQGSQLILNDDRYPSHVERLALWESVLDGLEARGIQSAVAINPPMAGSNMPFGWRTEEGAEEAFAQYHTVSEQYFDVMKIPVTEGRGFSPEDLEGAPPVVIVNDALVATHFPGEDPVGRVIEVVATPRTIVGVVGGTRHAGPDIAVAPELYVPLAQDAWTLGHVLMRTPRADASQILTELLGELDPAVPMQPATPYSGFLREWFAPLRAQLVIIGTLAIVGLLLAALGLYALVAYHVSSRQREIGIRMALGAPGGTLFIGIVRRGALLATAGLVSGFLLWYAMFPLTSRLIHGLSASGLLLPLLVALLVGSVTVLATLGPARRSTTIDPVRTLTAD